MTNCIKPTSTPIVPERPNIHHCAKTAQNANVSKQTFTPPFPPLELVNKPNLTTAELAYYLNRRPQTLRGWACRSGTGPIQAKRVGGILAWSTAEAKVLTGVAE